MSTRGLSLANLAAASADVVRPALFAEFQFVGGTVRYWTGIGTKVVFGETFVGLGILGPVTGMSESTVLEARAATFSLSGIPTALVTENLINLNRGRTCKFWWGFLDENRNLVDDPFLRFAGRIDQVKIEEEGDTCKLTVPAEDLLALLTRPKIFRLSHEEQQRRHPGDLGLQYLVPTSTKTIYFGMDEPKP